MDKIGEVKKIRNLIEGAILRFALDYHRYEDFRHDIIIKGIKSHPQAVEVICQLFEPKPDEISAQRDLTASILKAQEQEVMLMAKRKMQSVKQRVATSGPAEKYARKKKGGKRGDNK